MYRYIRSTRLCAPWCSLHSGSRGFYGFQQSLIETLSYVRAASGYVFPLAWMIRCHVISILSLFPFFIYRYCHTLFLSLSLYPCSFTSLANHKPTTARCCNVFRRAIQINVMCIDGIEQDCVLLAVISLLPYTSSHTHTHSVRYRESVSLCVCVST